MTFFIRLISFTITILLYCFHANAQTGYGARVGLNFAKYNLNESIGGLNLKVSSKTGLHTGFFYNISSGNIFSIQPEVNFSKKGVRQETTDGEVIKRNFNYLELNLIGKTTIGNENIKGFLNLGPGFGYLMSGKEKNNFLGNSKIDLEAQNIRRWDTVIHIGLGAAVRLGFENAVFLEGRYSLSVSDLYDIEDSLKPEWYKPANHRVFSLTIGYIYYLDGFEIQ